MLKLKILSAIKFIESKKKHADTESIYDQLMKASASNLEKSSIDEVLSKLINHTFVSNKKTSAGFDSYLVMRAELGDDQMYFSLSDSDENSPEQMRDDIPNSS